jgi:hypothetical protein
VTGKVLSEGNAETPISSIHWLKHGFFAAEKKRVSCWSKEGNNLKNKCTHLQDSDRLFYSSQNPKKSTEIVTASPDEKVKFWSVEIDTPVEKPKMSYSPWNNTIR